MKNGRMISSRIRPLNRPALYAVKYASGKEMTRQRIVAMPAYRIERPNCSL
jgi:hypothetical protein